MTTGQPPAGTVSWAAVSAAAGLVTAARERLDIGQDDLLAGQPPGEVLAALAAVTASVLAALPGDGGARVVKSLGLLAATRDAGRPVTGGQSRA